MTDTSFRRRKVLADAGASGPVLEELLAYNENRFDASGFGGQRFPLPDEPHVEAWREYAADAGHRGFTTAVGERLPQLRFPIERGVSKSAHYIAATRRGVVDVFAPFLKLLRPDGVRLRIHQTIAGALPVIVAAERRDFEDLVRALSCRNEPVEVPRSMGACIVTGLTNWDRVRNHRRRWEALHPDGGEVAWKAEHARFAEQKELYQDRLLILSSGPYSAVTAAAAGFSAEEWQRLSIEIRLEHECTHYFTLRVLGSMRDNLLDEIIADYVGLVRVLGAYRRDLALLFFGLEEHPRYRSGGRLENYRGSPPLSDEAFAILQSLVHAAVSNIAEAEERDPANAAGPEDFARRVVALASSSLEVLAHSADAVHDLVRPRTPAIPNGLDLVIHDHSGLERAIEEFRTFAAAQRLKPKAVSDFCIVLDEFLSNVIKYGFAARSGTISLTLSLEGDDLNATIVDDAPRFNVIEAPTPQTELATADRPIGGLGIHIVRQLSDEIRYEWSGGANRVFIRKRMRHP